MTPRHQSLSIDGYARLPLIDLSNMITPAPAHKLPISVGSLVLDGLMRRSLHNTKRGQRDAVAAISVLTSYRDMGGKV